MPREVMLPPIDLEPEDIARRLFKNDKKLAESKKNNYKNTSRPADLKSTSLPTPHPRESGKGA